MHPHCLLKLVSILVLSGAISATPASSQAGTPHTFAFGGRNGEQFLLDGKPFQMIGGEMHPSRIPQEYWRPRIQMAKAMGVNTVPMYVFWNDHEREEGKFDFTTGSRDLEKFLSIAGEEGVWVVLRPGPYVCAEWDFGGIPTYLLRYPDLKIRCLQDTRYTKAVERYFHELAKVARPHLVANGGPILMVQIENEYGNFERRDPKYMAWLRELWIKEGVPGPFCTADGWAWGMSKQAEEALADSVLPGAAVGLDPASSEHRCAFARKVNPGVPIFSAETYPGWLCHWGEKGWTRTDLGNLLTFFMDTKKSFSLYVFHGGTNFGFTAGANADGPGKYLADVTSYDLAAPLDEQGRPTPVYHAMRKLLASYLPKGTSLPDIPPVVPTMPIPEIKLTRWTTIWDHMPVPIEGENPAFFESLGQNQGLMVYRTKLPAGAKGKLSFERLHDYGLVFIGGKHLGTLDRSKGEREIDIPEVGPAGAVLEVLVEGMGHINSTIAMEQDRKGILGDVKLGATVLRNWQMFPFPLEEQWVTALPKTAAAADRPGGIFRGTFTLDTVADTFLDTTAYKKGFVWLNGHNLGRYWHIGPQKRLYCPAPWLRKGLNEIVVLDLHETEAQPIVGRQSGSE